MREMVTIEDLRQRKNLLFEGVAGSHAYGLATPASDTDLRGVFIQPKEQFLSDQCQEQVQDEMADEVYYELGRFIHLLERSNPSLLELCFLPAKTHRYRHELFDLIKPEWLLSKVCLKTFGGYAEQQVRKARGRNKKIVNPFDGPRKSLLSFCRVFNESVSMPLLDWLEQEGMNQSQCGLAKWSGVGDTYGLYVDRTGDLGFSGIVRREQSTSLATSSIPKGHAPAILMYFNVGGFSRHCREYASYHDWLENRNEARYQTNQEHGKGYDSKNMMHTFRLLDLAEDIVKDRTLGIPARNRDFLLKVRAGNFEFEELLTTAGERLASLEELYQKSSLPDEPDRVSLRAALAEIRARYYRIAWP